MPENPYDDLFGFQQALRYHAVWQHPLDTAGASGVHHPLPRFVAVVKDVAEFQRLRRRARAIKKDLEELGKITRWVPSFFAEQWVYATVSESPAYTARRITSTGQLPLRLVATGDVKQEYQQLQEEWKAITQAFPFLQGEVTQVPEEEKILLRLDFSTSMPVTARQDTGSRYHLYARTVQGKPRNHVRVGAVVVQGLQHGVREAAARKRRSDAKKDLFRFGGWGFYP
ncbi:hypothetical protein [Deinococcus cellulosilyticus]|uniref:Uncharacterized protein n=1 Tax=Deinococcus cellulosilyticus (strain DSM 18568 / NBRC 106333 / KACC 11606 / 5516J-15) TaxID=1223518 RepID=A0A511N9Z2_DEIC1|nr:hypothetical protein [Deinococcus cellulosilyticus]GEM49649.1 hypothetical protein DC3_52840 [Deinococcus cellulosilyticus NBRC 106333 = KACC 11606]